MASDGLEKACQLPELSDHPCRCSVQRGAGGVGRGCPTATPVIRTRSGPVAPRQSGYPLALREHRTLMPELRPAPDDDGAGAGGDRQTRPAMAGHLLPVDAEPQTGSRRTARRATRGNADDDRDRAFCCGLIEMRAQMIAFLIEGQAAALLGQNETAGEYRRQ